MKRSSTDFIKDKCFRPQLMTLFGISLAFMLLAGCGPKIGPNTIPRDRFDYGTAIGDSWKTQMLLNIVKLRYADTPVFLDVTGVVNQYSLEGQINLGGGLNTGFTGDDTAQIGATGRYADRPTITYMPLIGPKFTTSILTPLPPGALLQLVPNQANIELF